MLAINLKAQDVPDDALISGRAVRLGNGARVQLGGASCGELITYGDQSESNPALRNALYIGRVRHKDQTSEGDHDPIIPAERWEAVQEKLDADLAAPKGRRHTKHRSLLAGIAFDGLGRRLSPSLAVARGKRFR